jgi:hypothetical protein
LQHGESHVIVGQRIALRDTVACVDFVAIHDEYCDASCLMSRAFAPAHACKNHDLPLTDVNVPSKGAAIPFTGLGFMMRLLLEDTGHPSDG